MKTRLAFSLTLSALLGAASLADAQSLLDRSPNMSGTWTGAPATLYFHFVHRFMSSDPPQNKVSNIPTFLVAAGLPKRVLVGLNYSTNSTFIGDYPNEYELLARWTPLSQDHGSPLDLGVQLDYNVAAEGSDAELSAARRFGRARILLAGRSLSDVPDRRFAVAAGAALRLNTYVALTGDYATLADLATGEKAAWSAGLHFAIPLTPHTFSLQATNTTVTTLQGASRGTDQVRYGFEFTIPLTLKRYFGKRAETVATVGAVAVDHVALADTLRAAPPDTVARVRTDTVQRPDTARPAVTPPPVTPIVTPPVDTTTRVTSRRADTVRAAPRPPVARPPVRVTRNGMRNFVFLQPRLVVKVGTTVEWTNNDPLPHTVTATDKSFDSGLIQPGKTYRHTFTKAGTFNYFCVPHPFMKGIVVVEAQ
jgi:amicyanin